MTAVKGPPIESRTKPQSYSTDHDVELALKRARDYIKAGGEYTWEFSMYIDCWLDKKLELRRCAGS